MAETSREVLMLLATLGSAVVGGVFFAFSSFVMAALARRPAHEGIAAMQTINVVVLNPGFLGVFVGTAVLALALALWASIEPADGTFWSAAGAALYVLGTFGVTVACNVPRNDALAAVDPAGPEAPTAWSRYVAEWTFWNHVRTAAAVAAAVCFGLAAR